MLASTLVDRYTCYLNALIILVNLFGCIFPSISCNRQLGVNVFAHTLNYLKFINLSSIVTPNYFCSLCSFSVITTVLLLMTVRVDGWMAAACTISVELRCTRSSCPSGGSCRGNHARTVVWRWSSRSRRHGP